MANESSVNDSSTEHVEKHESTTHEESTAGSNVAEDDRLNDSGASAEESVAEVFEEDGDGADK